MIWIDYELSSSSMKKYEFMYEQVFFNKLILWKCMKLEVFFNKPIIWKCMNHLNIVSYEVCIYLGLNTGRASGLESVCIDPDVALDEFNRRRSRFPLPTRSPTGDRFPARPTTSGFTHPLNSRVSSSIQFRKNEESLRFREREFGGMKENKEPARGRSSRKTILEGKTWET